MGIVDTIFEAIAANPTLTVIVLTLLLLVFGGYFFLRRIVVKSMQGYQQGKRGG
jgi:uncharacterized protein YneF (UPF0154 family)